MTSPYRRPEPVSQYIIAASILNALLVVGGLVGYVEYQKSLIRNAWGSVPSPQPAPTPTLSESEQFNELLNRKVRQK